MEIGFANDPAKGSGISTRRAGIHYEISHLSDLPVCDQSCELLHQTYLRSEF